MAENKKSFILYCDIVHTIGHLTDDQAGKLFKHILNYVNDKKPVTEDVITNLAFEPIKQQLKRDLNKWSGYIEKQRVNGAKGGRPKETQKTQAFSEKPKKADNVNVTVNDTVNERENTAPLIEYRIEECLTVAMNDERWVKANKATINDLKEFNGLLERRGHYKKNPADYKSHFANWKKSGKKETYFDKKESSGPPLKTLEELNGN